MLDTHGFHNTLVKAREYLLKKGLVEVPVQSRLSILAACEDPATVSTFNYDGIIWPLPQTGQMWLEHELLKNPSEKGFFCVSTSYRNEPNPVPGRHDKVFPMLEFEMKGNQHDLIEFEHEFVEYLLGEKSTEVDYEEMATKYNVSILENEHEDLICKDHSASTILKDFPRRTSPFWNMRRHNGSTEYYKKVDVLIDGIETIGSAERAVSVEEMKEDFYTISNGEYAKLLFDKFGKDRVEKELNEYLSNDFFERFGGGIGMTRLTKAYNKRFKRDLKDIMLERNK